MFLFCSNHRIQHFLPHVKQYLKFKKEGVPLGFKKAREAAGFTLQEAAKKIGVSFQAISLWENGRAMPSASRLPKIAEVYCCDVGELLSAE